MKNSAQSISVKAPVLAVLIFIFLWDISIRLFNVSHLILPSPMAVLNAIGENTSYLVKHSAVTLLEAAGGFVLGSTVACVLAVLFFFSKQLENALYPYAISMKAIPLVALAPVVVAWCGGGYESKVILAAVISFFPVLVNANDGFKAVDKDALELMHSLSASKWDIFCRLQLPQALPQLFAGLKIASSFSVVGAVVAEFVNAEAGIGFAIKSTSYYLDTDLTFAAIFFAALIGLLFFGFISLLQKKFTPWMPKAP